MRASPRIVLASMNFDKFREMRSLFAKYAGLELVSPEGLLRNADKIGAVEIHEGYLENASAKARLVNLGCHYPALADDSGLEVSALGGRPGARSARYAKIEGYPSKITQDRANVERLLAEMKGQTDRNARFVCTLALIIEGVLLHATGTLDGSISEAPRGEHGFGYDPVFIPQGSSRTLGEMSEAEKNAMSHRAIALDRLMAEVEAHGIQFAKP